jgi:hypothetical protein
LGSRKSIDFTLSLFCSVSGRFLVRLLSLWWYIVGIVGCGDEESTGEEHQIGEFVLADLELGSPEEAGFRPPPRFLFFNLRCSCFLAYVIW